MCEVLLKSGAEMNAADDKYGWTALMLAVQHKYVLHSPFQHWNKTD